MTPSDKPVATSSRSQAAAPADAWSRQVGGLRVRLDLPEVVTLSPPSSGGSQAVETTISVKNESDQPIRILLVRPEMFRLFTSSLRVWQNGKVVSLQPDPHPHGYLLTEDDFVMIAPGATTTYQQTLYLGRELARPGDYEIELMFENQTKSWPGGVGTLDGVTKPLFGGKDVPHLWIGKLSTARRRFTVRA